MDEFRFEVDDPDSDPDPDDDDDDDDPNLPEMNDDNRVFGIAVFILLLVVGAILVLDVDAVVDRKSSKVVVLEIALTCRPIIKNMTATNIPQHLLIFLFVVIALAIVVVIVLAIVVVVVVAVINLMIFDSGVVCWLTD